MAESKRLLDRKQMDGYMQGFNSPQRGRALGFAQGIHKGANQINDKTTGKPRLIHLPNRPQASVVTAFLKDRMSAGKGPSANIDFFQDDICSFLPRPLPPPPPQNEHTHVYAKDRYFLKKCNVLMKDDQLQL